MLRHTLPDKRVELEQVPVFFFGGVGVRADEPAVFGYQTVLIQDPEIAFHRRNFKKHLLIILVGDQQNFAGFYRIDVQNGGLIANKAFKVGNPPTFPRQQADVFLPFIIDCIGLEESLTYKRQLFAVVAFLQ